ncbi:MAG: response regulator transcription factor [Opitutaceae bacterium]
MLEALRVAMQGRRYFSPVPSRDNAEADEDRLPLVERLSPTELQVFVIIGGGCDEQRAADWLGMSKHTVHTHLQRVMRELGVQTRVEVMREALRRGYVRLTPERTLYPGSEHLLAERARRCANGGRTTEDGGRRTEAEVTRDCAK